MSAASGDPEPPTLDHQKKPSEAASAGCLSLAIVFAVLAGAATAFGALFIAPWAKGALAAGSLGFIALGYFASAKLGMKRATALVIVALAVFGLMFGLCASGPYIF